MADDGSEAVGGPVAVGQAEYVTGVSRVIRRRISELTSYFRVAEHVEVLLPPDVWRAADPVGIGKIAVMEAGIACAPNVAKVKQSNDDMSK